MPALPAYEHVGEAEDVVQLKVKGQAGHPVWRKGKRVFSEDERAGFAKMNGREVGGGRRAVGRAATGRWNIVAGSTGDRDRSPSPSTSLLALALALLQRPRA